MNKEYLSDTEIDELLGKGILPDRKFSMSIASKLNQAGIRLKFEDRGIRWTRDQSNVSNPL